MKRMVRWVRVEGGTEGDVHGLRSTSMTLVWNVPTPVLPRLIEVREPLSRAALAAMFTAGVSIFHMSWLQHRAQHSEEREMHQVICALGNDHAAAGEDRVVELPPGSAASSCPTRLSIKMTITMPIACLPYGAVVAAAATAVAMTKKAVLSVPLVSSLEDGIQAYLVTAMYLSQKAEAGASCMGLLSKSKSISSDTVWDNEGHIGFEVLWDLQGMIKRI
ncbi:hypothetical protein B0H10DRAFT_1942576 [Mycena sp. CBHHK59/15]|nr:hypothetical protein B0H10DRAFT_1942576 [Mycena sp. CBHHK59/15]